MKSLDGLTPKGARTAAQILDAAIVCVARDGVAASSMQRIADQAEVGKRAVVYYYGTREGLLDHVVRRVAERMLAQIEEAVAGQEEPSTIVERGFEALWAAVTTDRALLAAWFGLHAESVTNPRLSAAASYITDQVERIVGDLVDEQLDRGRRLVIPRDVLLALVSANVQGFAAYFLDHGETPALRSAITTFQRFMAMSIAPANTPSVLESVGPQRS